MIEAFEMVGILAVEMFLTKTGEILVNEAAPRPHNSGHQTIEANYCSQYEMHFRSITDLPLGNTAIVQPSVMVNILGDPAYSGPPPCTKAWKKFWPFPACSCTCTEKPSPNRTEKWVTSPSWIPIPKKRWKKRGR